MDLYEIFEMREEGLRGFSRFGLRFCVSRRYLHANRNCGRTSPVYPVPTMFACAMKSFGNRRKLTASMDNVNTSLTFGWPRSLT